MADNGHYDKLTPALVPVVAPTKKPSHCFQFQLHGVARQGAFQIALTNVDAYWAGVKKGDPRGRTYLRSEPSGS